MNIILEKEKQVFTDIGAKIIENDLVAYLSRILDDNSRIAIVGDNNSDKTTLLKLMLLISKLKNYIPYLYNPEMDQHLGYYVFTTLTSLDIVDASLNHSEYALHTLVIDDLFKIRKEEIEYILKAKRYSLIVTADKSNFKYWKEVDVIIELVNERVVFPTDCFKFSDIFNLLESIEAEIERSLH